MISISGGLPALIESIYLGEEIGSFDGGCNIVVNPRKIKYLTGKICIINSQEYEVSKIEQLIYNDCKVILRVFPEEGISGDLLQEVLIQPYILRVCPDIMWNGDCIKKIPEIIDIDSILLGTSSFCRLKLPEYKLLFPKIISQDYSYCLDKGGNLNCLGWVLQQVGINIKSNTVFKDLDVIKTGKTLAWKG